MQHLLFLVHRFPYPPNKGDKVRSYHLLRHLAKHYRVHLGAFIDSAEDWRYVDEVRQYCGEFHFEPLSPRRATLKSALGLLSGEALTLPYYRNGNMQRWVDRVLRRHPIERVLVYSSPMAQYVSRHAQLTRVADFVDIDSDKWLQYAASKRWPLSWVYRREATRLFAYEQAIAGQFDATTFVSGIEAQHFREMAPPCAAKVGHANNGVDSAYFDPQRGYDNPYPADVLPVVFTGAMDYWPNVDAVSWFAHEVLPLLRSQLPRAAFYIVGTRPTDAVKQLANLPGVTVTGSVPDVRPYLAHGALAVAPLRIARGVQNKVLEAMSMGKAVIASPQAAEGIEAEAGRDLLVAHAPTDYVMLAQRVLAGELPLLGQAARSAVTTHYDWDANLAQFEQLLIRPPQGGQQAAMSAVSALRRAG